MHKPGLHWGKEAWAILEKAGLTRYTGEFERYDCIFRFLMLGGLYREFCDIAFDSYEYLDYDIWVESLDLDPKVILTLLKRNPDWKPVKEESWDPLEDNSLDFLVEQHRDEVYKALLAGFGNVNLLYAWFWNWTHTPDPSFVHEDEEETNPVDDPFWPETIDRMQAFEWISEGCPRYR
ncbi:MAG: hypothetical protein JXA82_08695 [Sedimentisphaerales bacterium]|nr:hypothetical protein [Sedimentisphaerales bacterium]